MRTPERVAEAQRMRAEGKKWREIGEALGVSLRTAHEWGTDPDSRKRDARRARYAGVCVDCGAATNGSGGPGKASKRCSACSKVWQRETYGIWDRERVIVAIQAWAERSGGIPPRACDWNVGDQRCDTEKFYEDGCWPHLTTVQYYFGKWSTAIHAAGFEPHQGHGTPEDYERTRLLYESGLTIAEIAKLEKRTPANIRWRLHKLGIELRDARRRYTAAERQRVIDAYLAGATIERAADVAGVTYRTAWRWIRDAGVPRRRYTTGYRKAAA